MAGDHPSRASRTICLILTLPCRASASQSLPWSGGQRRDSRILSMFFKVRFQGVHSHTDALGTGDVSLPGRLTPPSTPSTSTGVIGPSEAGASLDPERPLSGLACAVGPTREMPGPPGPGRSPPGRRGGRPACGEEAPASRVNSRPLPSPTRSRGRRGRATRGPVPPQGLSRGRGGGSGAGRGRRGRRGARFGRCLPVSAGPRRLEPRRGGRPGESWARETTRYLGRGLRVLRA